MIRFFGQMMMLPVTALTTGIDVFTRAVRGKQSTPDEGSPASAREAGSAPGEAGGHTGDPGPDAPAAVGEFLDEGDIKLVEYTVISLKRGKEKIVDRGQTIVSEPESTESFSSRMVDEASRARKVRRADRRHLRVYFKVLTRWPQHEPPGAA